MMLSSLLLLSVLPSVSAEVPVWDLVQSARRDALELVELNAEEQHSARQFFQRVLRSAESGELLPGIREEATALGLHLRVEENRLLLWGREDSLGLYVIRLGPAKAALLQAPHSFYDLGSGQLTSRLFESGEWRAAYFNTGHRYGGPGLSPDQRPDPTPDLAHNPFTMYQAATLAAVDALPEPLVVQVHGFRSREGESAVITPGSALQPSRIHLTVQSQLASVLQEWGPVLGAAARPELAGRRNVQGRVLSGDAHFLHLELSKSSRDGLNADEARRIELSEILLGVLP